MSFTNLGLSAQLIAALESQDLTTPTPIQTAAIPPILENKDILGIAKTGSGKTASYVLPILEKLKSIPPSTHREPTTLVLVPTRELALQVHSVFQTYIPAITSDGKHLNCIAIHGGVSINPQMLAVGKADIIVCTPGRLLDLIQKNALKLSSIKTLVLDEADKMLNLGFKKEIDQLLALLPNNRQNLLFSATLSDDLTAIQQILLTNPTILKISEDTITPDAENPTELIKQTAYLVPNEKKGPLLRYLIKTEKHKQVLVFASSTHKVDAIADKLRKNKIQAGIIHSKRSQGSRQETLADFKSGKLPVLVTTDLLARGIDIDSLPCVINYELPRSPKDYIHRIGRTGRANTPGKAISLIAPEEEHHLKIIQKKTKQKIPTQNTTNINLHGF